nr:hypothetical protein CFP56_50249 [Quercus suber]
MKRDPATFDPERARTGAPSPESIAGDLRPTNPPVAPRRRDLTSRTARPTSRTASARPSESHRETHESHCASETKRVAPQRSDRTQWPARPRHVFVCYKLKLASTSKPNISKLLMFGGTK